MKETAFFFILTMLAVLCISSHLYAVTRSISIVSKQGRNMLALFLIAIQVLALHGCATDPIVPSRNIRAYANSIVDHKNVYAKSNLNYIVGVSEFPSFNSKNCTLGNGWVIVDMGQGEEIIDLDGPDLRVYESDPQYDPTWKSEPYEVFVSNNKMDWTSLGEGDGVTNFDLRGSNLAEVRYVKIQGIVRWDSRAPGPDIEAVEALHMKLIDATKKPGEIYKEGIAKKVSSEPSALPIKNNTNG